MRLLISLRREDFLEKTHQTNQKHQKLGNGSQVAQHMDLGQPWLDTLVL